MNSISIPHSKVGKLRLASTVCWWLSAGMTTNFVFNVMKGSFDQVWLAFVISLFGSAAVQYVLTLVETSLFDSTLPAPWKVNYRDGGPIPWLMLGALLCLLMDVLLNVGGVGFFMSKLHTADIGQKQFNMSEATVVLVETVGTVVFAVLCAVGSELLDEFANYIEKGPQHKQVKTSQPQQEEIRRMERSRPLPQRDMSNDAREMPKRTIDPRDVKGIL